MPGHVHHSAPPVIKRHYTMRKSPYLVSLIFLLAATTLTLLNIYVPSLLHVIVRNPGPTQFETRYGLYRRCTRSTPVANATFLQPSHPPATGQTFEGWDLGPINGPVYGDGDGWVCQAFPTRSECQQFGEKFCVLWSTSGYAAQLSLVPCLASLISLLFIFLHRAKARRQQWKLVSGTMLIHCILQILSIALILHVFRTDERFEAKGSHLDQSFYYGVSSTIVSGIMALLLTFTALAARAGKPWAAGKSAKRAKRHRRTRSGRVIAVPPGTEIPPEEVVTVGEVRAAQEAVSETTGLLSAQDGGAAEGGGERATDNNV
uniref:Uncharacterized protein n=1 Tax=Kwoniella dejecticola CBS 10117 TaxID=1296121 RepID=A0A1A6A0E0_9TREE|nr:uncharacterized protein I303_05786 [Kwoniella dejecticola CBS 10117]OBR83506.1 hypothetical protein I303_05786 [Kwoniella dejecticola CBS 10117]